MAREIVITVEPSGSTGVEAFGFEGKGCTEATKQIEEALGAVNRRTHKKEFYQKKARNVETNDNKLKAGN